MGIDNDEGLEYEIDESSRDEGFVYIRSNTLLGLAAAIEEVHMWKDEKGQWNCTPEENMNIDEFADDDDISKYTHIMILHEYE